MQPHQGTPHRFLILGWIRRRSDCLGCKVLGFRVSGLSLSSGQAMESGFASRSGFSEGKPGSLTLSFVGKHKVLKFAVLRSGPKRRSMSIAYIDVRDSSVRSRGTDGKDCFHEGEFY